MTERSAPRRDIVWDRDTFETMFEPEPNTGCWLWLDQMFPSGYGRFAGTRRAHRVAYEFYVGPIADGLYACHRCDTKLCVNPAHLFLGTVTDNNRDCTRKGRHGTANRTECRHGHAWTPENTAWVSGARRCLACRAANRLLVNARNRERHVTKRAEINAQRRQRYAQQGQGAA